MQIPVYEKISSYFNATKSRTEPHNGIDFEVEIGTQVNASMSGTIVRASFNKTYGNMVIIDHGLIGGKHVYTLYAHLSRFADGIQQGQWIGEGIEVGLSGDSGTDKKGKPYPPHLHFEVIESKSAIQWNEEGNTGVPYRAGRIDPLIYFARNTPTYLPDLGIPSYYWPGPGNPQYWPGPYIPEDDEDEEEDSDYLEPLAFCSELIKTASTVAFKDPLILDLDGDGVETTNVKDGAYFDHDGNGFAEQTGWAGSDDGQMKPMDDGRPPAIAGWDDGRKKRMIEKRIVDCGFKTLHASRVIPLKRDRQHYGSIDWLDVSVDMHLHRNICFHLPIFIQNLERRPKDEVQYCKNN